MPDTMLGDTLLIIAAMASLAAAALLLARRWAASATIRLDRLRRDLEATSAHASDTATLLRQRMEALQHRLDEVDRRSERRSRDAHQLLVRKSSAIVRATRANVAKDLAATFTQLESLHNLYAIAPPAHPLPSSRGWAASPDLLLLLVDRVAHARPRLTVECGSGLSTLWLAVALRRFAIDGRVVALEHDAAFAARTRRMLARHEVDAYAEVRDAPLHTCQLGDREFRWYAADAWSDLDGIRMLFVDGPPASTGPLARYPALPLLSSRLDAEASIVLDDMKRDDEQETVRHWLDENGELAVEHLPLEKKAAVLTRVTSPAPEAEDAQAQEPAG